MFKISSHLVRNHPRLLAALAIGVIIAALLPIESISTRILLGWDITVWTYLILIWVLMVRARVEQVAELAQQEDESAVLVLTIVCAAALASVAAIILELATARHSGSHTSGGLHLLHAVVTLLGAWFLIPTIFTLHYARQYFNAPVDDPPLRFPDKQLVPHYWDFLYFSFTLAVASQTSDVVLCSSAVRRAVLGQSILAFFFNASILALAINIAAGLVSN